MRVLSVSTETQTLVSVHQVLEVEDLDARVKTRTVRIRRARIEWRYIDPEVAAASRFPDSPPGWSVNGVQVSGPLMNTAKGVESTAHADRESTAPAARGIPTTQIARTPPELEAAAEALMPSWVPRLTPPSPYPRPGSLRNSL